MFTQPEELLEVQSKLLPWLQNKMPQARNLSISEMKVPEAGFSTDTFLFDVNWEEAGQQKSEGMVIRRPPELSIWPDYDLGLQVKIMQCLQRTNIPVPKVHWMERNESILGSPFFIMNKIDGVIPSSFPLYHTYGIYLEASPAQRTQIWWAFMDVLAKVHLLDWKGLGLSSIDVPEGGTGPVDWLLDYNENYLNWVNTDKKPLPILEAALGWLKANRYTPEHVTLCWGDSRLSNVIYSADFEVAAVLDWEMAYLGDPESDLGWAIFLEWSNSYGSDITPLEGTPRREEIVQRYQELTGYKVNNLFYNEVLAPFRLGVSMLRLYNNLKEASIALLPEDFDLNNPCTQRLAGLLNLPSPNQAQG